MNEMQKIAAAFRAISSKGQATRAALATVVRVTGSAYRRPGARMLVSFDDAGKAETVGTISGGCLERDVIERAVRVCETGASEIAVYDSRTGSDQIFGTGTGCGGAIEILIESIFNPHTYKFLSFLAERMETRTTGAAATIIGDNHHVVHAQCLMGQRLLLAENSDFEKTLTNYELLDDLQSALRSDFKPQIKSYAVDKTFAATCEVFVESIQSAPALVIFGAGDDAQPLARFASETGWHVTVCDHRAAFANSERFPIADRIIVARPDEIREKINFDRRTFAVLMTHNYEHDQAVLKFLLPSPITYIGCLGTRKRTDRMLLELCEDGASPDFNQIRKIYSPVGLDTGAETPFEIAVSILAELRAVLSNRTGGHLRNRYALNRSRKRSVQDLRLRGASRSFWHSKTKDASSVVAKLES